MDATLERFAAAVTAFEEALDWAELGASYCEGEARDFFSSERVDALRDAGLRFASDLGGRLAEGGSSLYVGAGVAEVVPVLFEALVLERRVRIHTADARETRLLGAALDAVEQGLSAGLRLPRWSTTPIQRDGAIDHLWFVSVATDPDHFPAHHDALYERGPARERHLEVERAVLDELVDRALSSVEPGALISTSGEEIELLAERAERCGLALRVPDTGRTSGLVGDVVYACTAVGR